MKKKKLFVGVLLASAAFSLAACTNSGNTTNGSTAGTISPTTVTTTPATPTTTPTTPTTTPTTPTADTTPTTPTTAPAAEKVTVSFGSRLDGSIQTTPIKALDSQEIDKGGTITLPSAADMEVAGYKFIGFETSTGAAVTSTTTFTKNTKIYCSYDTERPAYTTLAASTENIIAYDFSDTTSDTTLGKTVSYSTKGAYDNGASTAAQVSFSNRKARVTYDSGQKGSLLLSLGETITNSVINGCFEIEIETGDKFGFFILVDENGDSAFTISMRGDKSGRVLGYKDGSEDKETAVTLSPNDTHFIEYSVDLTSKKVSIKLDGTVALDNVTVAGLGAAVKGIKFETKASSCNLTVDAIALNKKTATIDEKKAAAVNDLKAKYDAYVDTDNITSVVENSEWATIETAFNTGKDNINGAVNFDDVDTALTNAAEALDTAIATLRTNKKSSLTSALTNATLENISTFKEKYDELTPVEKTQADTAFASIKAKYLAEDELAKIKTVKELYDYSQLFYAEVLTIFKEKVTVTVNYIEKVYDIANITEFAEGTTYYVIGRNGLFTEVKSDATFSATTDYYTCSLQNVSTKTFKNIKNEKLDTTLIPTVDGYYNYGIYSDDNISTEFNAETILADTATIYVEVNDQSIWNCKTDVKDIPLASVATSVNLTSGTQVTAFCTTDGTVAQKFNGKADGSKENTQCIGYEIAKNKGSSIVVTVGAGQTLTITFGVISTGSSNTTTGIYLSDSTSAVVEMKKYDLANNNCSFSENKVTVYSSSDATYITYELGEGTYKLVTEETGRGARVTEIISQLA